MARPELTDNARHVLESRYLRRDDAGRGVETPEEMLRRVARAVAHAELVLHGTAEAERWEREFLDVMASLDFLPNSPTLMYAGTELGQLAACFVLPVEDSMEGIFGTLRDMALVQRAAGGTGFSFSRLREKGRRIRSTGGRTPGPVSFLRAYDCATREIRLGGRRRGANMGILRVDHPDVLDFVDAKREEGALGNFNLSVAVTDDFMEALEEGGDYALVSPFDDEEVGRLEAAAVWERIADAAHATGDPGLVFLDAINADNPTPHLGEIEATNPCGEVPLLPYEACNLGSINLSHMLEEGPDGPRLDREKLEETTRTAVRFLDDVVEVNDYPLEETARMCRTNRKVGLGVMGFAEMLVELGVPYDADRAVELAGEVMELIDRAAGDASRELAGERGVYPGWEGSVHDREGVPIRNATRTAVAPTGTISIIAGTSPSIEPLFALAYRRENVLDGESLPEVNPLFRRRLERSDLDADRVAREVARQGSLAEVEGVPGELKRLFRTALEIDPEDHLRIQAAFQAHTDNSVSKTINLPEDAAPGDVDRIYRRAWNEDLKGVTVYRYGSKSSQVMELGVDEEVYEHEHGPHCDPGECRL